MHEVLRFIVLIAFGLIFPSCRAIAHENVITWATNPNYPPYSWSVSDAEYTGACIELLSMIAPKGYVFKAVVVPWARAQAMAEEGRIDMLINIRKTPERD
jgi:polar amino acid transport system substrate-binding protein